MGGLREMNPEVRPGINTSGSAMAKGVAVKLKATPTVPDEVDLEASNTGAFYGVTKQALANNAAGDIAISGRVLALAGAAIAAGVRVMPDTGGKFVTATAGNTVAGLAVTAASGDATYFELELQGPGGAEMPG